MSYRPGLPSKFSKSLANTVKSKNEIEINDNLDLECLWLCLSWLYDDGLIMIR